MTAHQHDHHGGRPGPQPYQALERRLYEKARCAAWHLTHRAERIHQQWGLRCATVPELRAWLKMAALADGHGVSSLHRQTFCRDACPAWCEAQRAAGRCSRAPSARNAPHA